MPRFCLALLLFACCVQVRAMDAWEAAYDPVTQSRFIPVALWTGGEWDGNRRIEAIPAELRFGNGRKSITGPVDWADPATGEKRPVYVRINGGKKQLFAISSRGDGLGRVADSRYARTCIDEVKFPLGVWRQGEKRIFDIPCDGGASMRHIELTIERIDFVHQGIPHALQYHWLLDGGRGRASDMHYIYSPGKGLVVVYGNE